MESTKPSYTKFRRSLTRLPGETLEGYVRRVDFELAHIENQASVHLNWHTHNDKRSAGECWICNQLYVSRRLLDELAILVGASVVTEESGTAFDGALGPVAALDDVESGVQSGGEERLND